jgi:adenylate kinase family enzyme
MSGQYQERKEYFKQHREKNKERLQQKRHDYYEETKDRIKEYAKQQENENPLNGMGEKTRIL